MKQLIKKEIDKINQLEERGLFKELLENVFQALYDKNLEDYQNLEKRIFDEVGTNNSHYCISCGLIQKEFFDASSSFYEPMLEMDKAIFAFRKEEIKKGILEKKPVKVMQLFLECDYLKLKEMLTCNVDSQESLSLYEGYLKTAQGHIPCQFSVKQNDEYLQRIYQLYQLFVLNGIPWRTVNNPYAFRMVDVYLESCADFSEESVEIEEVCIDFGKYQDFIRHDMIPVWNIKRKQVTSVGFPLPCENHKSYQHIISLKKEQADCGYLLGNGNVTIHSVENKEKQLIVTTDTDELQNWDVYIIQNNRTKQMINISYPFFENSTTGSFLACFHNQNNMRVRTQAELIRFLDSYGFKEYLEFDHFEIIDESQAGSSEVYSMNEFLIEEIRQQGAKKCLMIFMVTKKADFFLGRDILSFLVSEVQLIYPEYHCMGKLL